MTNKALLEQLEEWHEQSKYKKIVETLLEMPQNEIDYELINHLSRALNNLSRYEEALSLLESVREQGQDDQRWHFKMGYSLYYIDGREVEAIPYLERAIELGDDWPTTFELLLGARTYLEEESSDNENDEPEEMSFTPKGYACVSLNMRLQPKDRHPIDASLDLMLRTKGLGCVSGGGTLLSPEGEPQSCDIEIDLIEYSDEIRQNLTDIVQKLDAAKGSKFKLGPAGKEGYETECLIGKLDGIAVYLNETDLPDEVYENNDVNDVIDSLLDILGTNGGLNWSCWEGPNEMALYFYGEGGVDLMLEKIMPYVNEHPLCQQARIVPLTETDKNQSVDAYANLYKTPGAAQPRSSRVDRMRR